MGERNVIYPAFSEGAEIDNPRRPLTPTKAEWPPESGRVINEEYERLFFPRRKRLEQ